MIDKKVMILAPLQDYSKHKLAKYIRSYMGSDYPFDLYYYKPLKEVVSKVIAYDFPQRMAEIGVSATNKEILDIVKKEKPDYFLWITIHYEFLESLADAIRKEGTKVIGLFFDDEWRFDEYSKFWIPHLDYIITGAAETLPKYKALGANVMHAICANCVSLQRKWTAGEEKYDVSFVGNNTFDREEYILEIKKRGILVCVFGSGWDKYGGRYVSFEELLDCFKSSKINLNFTKTHHGRSGWKGRIFQVCAAGGFLLTEYLPGIEDYFEIGREIVCFKTKEEMISKIQYYLEHEEERRKIARAGWEKVNTKYLPRNMMLNIFNAIESGKLENPLKGCKAAISPEMPPSMRRRFSNYYLHWAIALSLDGPKNLWKDALQVSLSYNPNNKMALFYGLVGSSPKFIKNALIKPMANLAIKSYRLKKKLLKNFLVPN